MRSELVAVASHELQTPLTTLRMTLLMLQESVASAPRTAARARRDVAHRRRAVDARPSTNSSISPASKPASFGSTSSRVHVSARDHRGASPGRGAGEGQGHRLDALGSTQHLPRISADAASAASRLRQHPVERAQVHADRGTHHGRRRSAAHERARRAATRVDQHHRHGTGHSGRVSLADLRQVLPPRTSSESDRAQRRVEPASACTCAGRSSNCTAATSHCSSDPTIAGPASR